MNYNHSAFTFLLLLFSGIMAAQSTGELEAKLKKAANKNDKLALSYQLAEKYLPNNPAKAQIYAQQANTLAVEVGDKLKEANSAFISADALYRLRKYPDASSQFVLSWNTARNFGLRDIAVNSAEKLQDIALKQNNYKEALKWSRETINYLKDAGGSGRGGGDSQRKLENQLVTAEADNRALREQIAKLTGQSQNIENNYQEQIKQVQEKTQQELNQKNATITQISAAKQVADSLMRTQNQQLANLTREQMEDLYKLSEKEKEITDQKNRVLLAEKEQAESKKYQQFAELAVIFVLLLAILFYFRYRSKRRTANQLSAQNKRIEEEQKRSNNLLLNILPPAIAEELKTRNKVAARKYDQATVMFVDFKGFTNVAEKLSPEMLVEELDFCFTNFDRIISAYRIEKIKTIGDAYMCASGLSDMNASPSDMVKAALQIQDFMLALKAERLSKGMPFFEARAGIHVGPVVAGVVGTRKFTYDIWGDTVNIAARMEETCEPGHVNVSEDAYWLSKYEFEWLYRGKVAAKNKGMMDMYYVTSMKTY
jgi:class 3 adenylate cyclase